MNEASGGRLDEPVEIVEYDPAWRGVFGAEALKLHVRLGRLALGIEHVGSTAVPGLRGKPVVDIMLGVRGSDLREDLLCSLLSGFDSLGEAGVSGRLYFRRREGGAVNLQVVEYAGNHWRESLLLRDYLRAHREDAERYGRAKERILGEGICMLLAYSEGKRAIIEDLLTRAHAWRPQAQVLRGKGT